MPLLDRVSTLLRANLNDLVSRAEDPEKLFRQLLQDMQNQLLQLRDTLARALADQHLLTQKTDECRTAAESWRNKAAVALRENQDDLARAALERCLTQQEATAAYAEQGVDQEAEVAALRDSYRSLQAKLEQTEAEGERLLLERRRARNARLPDASATAVVKASTLRE